jgi:hypothetical protein
VRFRSDGLTPLSRKALLGDPRVRNHELMPTICKQMQWQQSSALEAFAFAIFIYEEGMVMCIL